MKNTEQEFLTMPMLALRGIVVFPSMALNFDVGRQKSIAALDRAMATDRFIFLLTQKDISNEDPVREDLYDVGVVARVRQVLRLPNKNVRVLIEGLYRAECVSFCSVEPMYTASIKRLTDKPSRSKGVYREALVRNAREIFGEYAEVVKKIPPDVLMGVMNENDVGRLADFIAANINVMIDDKQFILEELNPVSRLKSVIKLLQREKDIMIIDNDINEVVREHIDQNQKEYYLKEQLRAINDELYGADDISDETDEYFEKILNLKAPDEIKSKLNSEVAKLKKMPFGSQEATVSRNYLDTCISLPWGEYTKTEINLKNSRKILDRDHYGLEKVKERITELLAVNSLVPDLKGQIICLVGPPGVGKTSIARAVAECMGRKYSRVSLGGVSDESEIRGHRRTYLGSMPGKIIDAVRRAGSSNPLILLDEIDKLTNTNRGDPSAALLEALDSEQNFAFKDHYIDLPFDLSRVLFVTTANSLDTVPMPLLDRMEVIELSSYTREEKFNIAKKHLIKKSIAEHGLTKDNCKISDSAIYQMTDLYTKEAGVRKLKREINKICRKAAAKIVDGETEKVNVTALNIKEYLGRPKYKENSLEPNDEVGFVNGLAWTAVGGVIMPLEVAVTKGTGKIEITGSLGDVMSESAKVAVTYVRSKAEFYGIDPDFYKQSDIHIHADEGAVPKDGPSAGVTMVTALVSALTGKKVKRDVAMTGEITLRGRVLPIGGLREKSMAAYAGGVKKIFIPFDNLPDLDDVDDAVLKNVEIKAVNTVDEIINEALAEDGRDITVNLNFAVKDVALETIN